MRFYLGETYESASADEQRWALVVKLADGGEVATLRFADSGEECTVRWTELRRDERWRQVVLGEAREPDEDAANTEY